MSPDGRQYLRIAENLVRNACYSVSDPATGACVPLWGNQPPGYPVFVASVSPFPGGFPEAVAALQVAAYGFALGYFVRRALAAGIRAPWVIAGSLLVAVSPALVGWSRWVLTETLSGAAFVWVLAESLRAVGSGRVPVLRSAIALAVCISLRWDMIFAAIPLGFVAFRLHAPPEALRRILSVGLLAAIPTFLWIGRAALVGISPALSPIPADEVPPGVLAFWRAAAVSQTGTASLLWSAWSREYDGVSRTRRPDSFRAGGDPAAVEASFERLGSLPAGQPVPEELDAAFAALAREHHEQGFPGRASLLVTRIRRIWTDTDHIHRNGYRGDSPADRRLVAAADAERRLLPVLCLLSLVFARGGARTLIAGMLAACFARTFFLASLTMLETRYLAPCLPALELAATVLLGLGRTGPSMRRR